MRLHSGKRIHAYKWDELPIYDYVIEKVESFSGDQGQPIMHDRLPNFEWTPRVEITDTSRDEEEEIPPLISEDDRHPVDILDEEAEPEIGGDPVGTLDDDKV